MKDYSIILIVLMSTLLSAASGCGKQSLFRTEPIDGTITLDGKPLEGASIALNPVSDETPDAKPAYGRSDSNGKFKITAANGGLEGRGTSIGKYKISVSKEISYSPYSDEETKERFAKGEIVQAIFKSAIPKKYNNSENSGLTFEVIKGKNVLNIDLKSK